jgi:hypothetical protein
VEVEGASGQTSSSSRQGGEDVAGAVSVGDGAVAAAGAQPDSAARETALRRCLRMREAAAKAEEGAWEEGEEEIIVGNM